MELLNKPTLLVAVVLAVCASLYYLVVICCTWRFRHRLPYGGSSTSTPPLSVLKPLRGADPFLETNLLTHALQDYPDFELLLGVESLDDPAAEVVDRLSSKFPDLPLKTIVCGPTLAGNPKIWQLERLAHHSHHDTFLVNDADIVVEPNYFREIVEELEAPNVGGVTCLYRARPGGGLVSLLEALWVSAEFQGLVLTASCTQGVSFALGATIAFRNSDLKEAGGFEVLRPFLADDYQLGNHLTKVGRRVVLSRRVVETVLPTTNWREVLQHWLRWSRTVRLSRPRGHAGLIFTHGTIWSLLTLLVCDGQTVPVVTAICCLALRGMAAWSVGHFVVQSETVRRYGYLIFLADLLAFVLWCVSFFGNHVVWAGRHLSLDRLGRIRQTTSNSD